MTIEELLGYSADELDKAFPTEQALEDWCKGFYNVTRPELQPAKEKKEQVVTSRKAPVLDQKKREDKAKKDLAQNILAGMGIKVKL